MQIARQAILLFSAAAVLLGAWLAPLDAPATERVDAGLKRALVSFGSARALNAVISMVQGTEISAQPMGFGVVFTPGQVLDPVNDLVEKFSDAMLAASVAFGVEKALMVFGGHWLVSALLTVALLAWAGLSLHRQRIPAWLSRLLLILLMVRFAVPAVTLGSDLLFERFLAADYAASQQAIDLAAGQIEKTQPPVAAPAADAGVLDRMKGWLAEKNLDAGARLEALKQSAEKITEQVINLIVIFLLQTLVIPLLLLWAMYGAAKAAFEWPGRSMPD
ncbi:MAG: hypothetical protein HZC22_04175 [Rhodocyclales bacterium]|nr:hypothetical protein [Rhodocyclales bacterium]